MNLAWLQYVLRVLTLAPAIVAGIEHIHAEAPGATKKQMAMDALGLAYGTASAVLPQDQTAIDAATSLTSNVIDGVVSVFNATGIFKTLPPAPAPVAARAPAAAARVAVEAPAPAAPMPAPVVAPQEAAVAPTAMPATNRD